ncbi:gephyrin-like molybdotransferase Glp [Paenibacillus humicola]|uniref:molybdopterin molybdotransferase MoeA n=1 Tax=Paenibacillus humicola TaxID=3110540 RepID=UPI00237BD7DE|nr:gephyrin-like molybdotransferase Glp [Paenibacillus humicola]
MRQLQGATRFHRRAIKVDEAIRLVIEASEPGRRETVPLWQAGGRRLAEPLAATTDWPPFARACMDGYAVRSADTALASPESPAELRVAGTVAAGELPAADVEAGTAVRIMTGAAVPAGADAVVMLEQTADALRDGRPAVRVNRAAEPGQNIAQRGEEFRRGSLVAGPGTPIRPGHAALLGTFGYADVPVFARPRVAVLATGAELQPVAAALAPGGIRDSNSAMLAAMVEQSGGTPLLLGSAADDPAAVSGIILQALQQADLVVTTGGVSVGDYDVMAALLRGIRETGAFRPDWRPEESDGRPRGDDPADFGASPEAALRGGDNSRLLFDKIAIRPGSPTSAAVVDGRLLIALSGSPGACFVGFELFVRPALRRLQGASREEAYPESTTARLLSDYAKSSPHDRFVKTKLIDREGVLYADPLAFGKSSMMASLPDADGLIRIPAGPGGAARGSIVDVLLLPRSFV